MINFLSGNSQALPASPGEWLQRSLSPQAHWGDPAPRLPVETKGRAGPGSLSIFPLTRTHPPSRPGTGLRSLLRWLPDRFSKSANVDLHHSF